MKELSIEEKARRYDEAIERAKDYYHLGDDKHKMAIDVKAVMEYIFPTLKESEDERMIQYFKDLAPFDKADELYEKYGFSHKDALAWLEKQCRHAKFINGIQVGDKVTRNGDGVLVNLSQLNRVAKKDEKQGEQKQNANCLLSWSEEDEAIWAEISDLLWEGYKQSGSKFSWDDIRNWVIHKLKSLRPQKQCCNDVPSREYILNVWELGNYWKELTKGVCSTEHGTQLEYIQNHWKEGEYYDKIIVCPQKQWKPSDEQLRELRCAISGCSFETPILVQLEEELKKLREN